MLFTIFALVFGLYITKLIFFNRRRNLPPGPFVWPIVGNLPQVATGDPNPDKFPHRAMINLAKTYGDVMYLRFGSFDAVVLSSFEAIRDLFNKEEFSGRYEFAFTSDRSFGKVLGVIFQSGEPWKELRRYSLRTLREFGFGKRSSTTAIMSEELSEFTAVLEENMKRTNGILTVDPDIFALTFINIIWSFVAGERASHTDETLKQMLKLNDDVLKSLDINNPSVPFPVLRKLFPELVGFNHQMKVCTTLQNFMRERIHKARSNYKKESDGNPRTFLECFIQEIEKADGNPKSIFNEEQLIILLKDFFLAGSETSSTTMTYAFLFMVLYPEVQKKIQQEIDTVGSPDHDTLEYSLLERMPYTEAVMHEVFRISHIIPLPSPRRAMVDYKYRDFVIPEGTAVFFNLVAVMTDKQYWGDPENFRPERFLDSTKTKCVNTERVIPFGFGKRQCLAETLGRESFFVYLTAFLKKYDLSLPPDTLKKPSPESKPNMTLRPEPFQIKMTKRGLGAGSSR